MTLAFDLWEWSRHFPLPHTPILVGVLFRSLTMVRFRLRPVDLLALSELTRLSPSRRDFYFRAFDELITCSAVGYHYCGYWESATDAIFTR
jgi:hypothetical protein